MTELQSFREALKRVNAERHDPRVARLLREPEMLDRRGRRVNVLARVHERVKVRYLAEHPSAEAIDWLAVLGWIKDHWQTILQIIGLVLALVL